MSQPCNCTFLQSSPGTRAEEGVWRWEGSWKRENGNIAGEESLEVADLGVTYSFGGWRSCIPWEYKFMIPFHWT